VKEFLLSETLPFTGVCLVVVGATFSLFGMPRPAPAVPSGTATQTRRMDEAMARAIAALKVARSQADATLPAASMPPGRPHAVNTAAPRKPNATATAAPPAAASAATTPVVDDSAANARAAAAPVLDVVSSLTEAVKAVREARTDEDFARAEDRMRDAREQMQNACTSGANSAFCDSAREMGSLGF
jgi:hypothetical protein